MTDRKILPLSNDLMDRIKTGRTLKDIRVDGKMSQRNVADLIGITYQAYAHYEKGRRNINIITAARIATVFKVSLEDILIAELRLLC